MQVGPFGSDFYAGFEQRDGIFEIILRHADPGQQKNDVGIFRSQFVGANQQIKRIDNFRLFGINPRHQVKSLGRIWFQFQSPVQNQFGFLVSLLWR